VDDEAEAQRLFNAAVAQVGSDAILTAAHAHVASADEPKFIPKLTKWLRGRGWEKPPRKSKPNKSFAREKLSGTKVAAAVGSGELQLASPYGKRHD
jgi:hypothetical protein